VSRGRQVERVSVLEAERSCWNLWQPCLHQKGRGSSQVPFLPSSPFSNYSFLFYSLANQWSDFSVAWKFSVPEQLFFCYGSNSMPQWRDLAKLLSPTLGTSYIHRNLRTRTSMLAQVLQIFLGKEHLLKNRLISTPDKVIYFKGTIFSGLQNLSSLHKIG
jgi:hypothetical protein